MQNRKIIIYVEKADDGTYWGSTENLPGGVSTFGNTLDELKNNFAQAFNDYLKLAEDLQEDWLTEVKKYDGFEYKLNISSFFRLIPEIKISGLAKKANINSSLYHFYFKITYWICIEIFAIKRHKTQA